MLLDSESVIRFASIRALSVASRAQETRSPVVVARRGVELGGTGPTRPHRLRGWVFGALLEEVAALEPDPKYAKAYYRRGSSLFALGHLKDAKKDFRTVCVLNPKSKDARAKLKACEKSIREAAFRKAIESEMTAPLSDSYDPNSIVVSESYDGPNPIVSGPTDDMELEASLFQPGKVPREFVLVS